VTGPSGCGKSTLARCLTGLIPHLYRGDLRGDVWIEDLSTRHSPLWKLAEHAGLVFQNPAAQMLAASVEDEVIFGLENLGLDRAQVKARLEGTLRRFGMATFRARSPQTLSGGEQQKLALAAVTARMPAVLVLDEPLSMLDGTAATELVARLAEFVAAGMTIVVCEHREEYLQGVPGLRTVRLPGSQLVACAPAEGGASPLGEAGGDPFRLEAQGITVRLGGRVVLRDVGFTAESGEVIAIVGRNGVGKTTLLRVLAGLQAHRGRVSVGGERPDLGMVFQNADLQLFNATVRDEILYRVPDPDLDLYGRLLEVLGLARYEEVPPLLLSEGEKKRVALATVLLRKPRHGVLLDEPALGQDAAHKRMLVSLARAVASTGRSVILTTHDLPLAAQADRLLLLGREGFVADGPPAEVLRRPEPWDRLGLVVPDWVLEKVA
jgi:energy-coupling factor transport system ATP-binding protein